MRAHIAAPGWQDADVRIFRDEGLSGASLNRAGLDRLRDAARHGECARVLITEPDRLARNYVHQMIVLDEVERADCRVAFLDRPMGADPPDGLVLQIRSAVAEYERTLIVDRLRRGRQLKYRAGILLPWTKPLYGYQFDANHPRDPAWLRIDAAQVAVIQAIFADYTTERVSLAGLARQLQAQGIPTPSGQRLWSLCTLRAILRQPAYTGQV